MPTASAPRLTEFYLRLADDPSLLEAYEQDPRRALPEAERRGGSLTVVGTGVDVVSQLTPAARIAIEAADEVPYLVADPVAALRVEALNPRSRSLDGFYGETKPRRETYAEVVDAIVSDVTAGAHVCAVLYGHPGVFAWPGHKAI